MTYITTCSRPSRAPFFVLFVKITSKGVTSEPIGERVERPKSGLLATDKISFLCERHQIPLMAKKSLSKARKRNVKFSVIKFDFERTLTTLASDALTSINVLSNNMARPCYAISIDTWWGKTGSTVGQGPLEVGFAHSDLSTAEVDECLLAEPNSPGEIIERERSTRPVRIAGLFSGFDTAEALNDGKPMRTKLGFTLDEDQNVLMWVKNLSEVTLTTGGVIRGIGKLYVRWL